MTLFLKSTLLKFIVLSACALNAQAQTWPTKTVKIVVPSAAGSSLDIIARLLAEKLREPWKQNIVVENKPGAGGLIGMDVAAKAAPDGHVIAIGFPGPVAFAPFLYAKTPYDPRKDLAPVVLTTSQPNVLAVNANVPANTFKELVDWLKAQNGKVNFASIGAGSSSHLSMELLKNELGFAATHIPYNGSPAAGQSVAAGDTQMLFAVASGIAPLVKAGKIKLLATTSLKRSEALKELPTIAESGYPNFEADAWNGLFVATGTPDAVVQKINADVGAVLRDAGVAQNFANQGMITGGGSVAEFKTKVERDTAKWGAIIRKIGITLD